MVISLRYAAKSDIVRGMRFHVALLPPDALREYLEQQGKGVETKHYELYASILLANFHRQQTEDEYFIALPAKRGRAREREIELDIEEFLRSHAEEDSAVDVAIVPAGEVVNRKYKPPKGYAYQLKRVICEDKDTEQYIADFLEKIGKKYSKTETALVLLLEHLDAADRTFNLGRVRELFAPSDYPFMAVLFVAGNRTANTLTLGQIWPDFGSAEYPYEDLLGKL
jgi:hypothetical protein